MALQTPHADAGGPSQRLAVRAHSGPPMVISFKARVAGAQCSRSNSRDGSRSAHPSDLKSDAARLQISDPEPSRRTGCGAARRKERPFVCSSERPGDNRHEPPADQSPARTGDPEDQIPAWNCLNVASVAALN